MMGFSYVRIRICVSKSGPILVPLDIRPVVPLHVVISAPLLNIIINKVLSLPPLLSLRGLLTKYRLPPLLRQRVILYKVKFCLPPLLSQRVLHTKVKFHLPPLLSQRAILNKVKFCLPPLLSLRVVIYGAIGNRAINLMLHKTASSSSARLLSVAQLLPRRLHRTECLLLLSLAQPFLRRLHNTVCLLLMSSAQFLQFWPHKLAL